MISSTNEKPSDWSKHKSVRRFPENNNVITNDNNNNFSNLKEIQHHSWGNDRDNHQSTDRKMQLQVSSVLKNSYNSRSTESNLQQNPLPRRVNPSALSTEETSLNPHNNYRSTSKVSNTISSRESYTSSVISSHKMTTIEDTPDNKEFIKSVLDNGEYLVKYGNWHEFRGPVETKKCSNKVIERNENVWEFIKIEYNYLKLLVNIKDVYYKEYPCINVSSSDFVSGRSSSTNRSETTESSKSSLFYESKEHYNNVFESIETILPGIEKMIEYHGKITDILINNHVIRPDRIITEIGRVMNESVPDDFIPILAQLYGCVNFAKKFSAEKLAQFKKYNEFQTYLLKCERDPRCDKKTVSDILLTLSMHWTKKLTTLQSIISNTMNDSVDLSNLKSFKLKVDNILNGASNVMDDMMNLKYLKGIVENYEIIASMEGSQQAFTYMNADNAKVIFYGVIQYELKKSTSNRVLTKEVHGIALEDCIFLLQTVQDPGRTTPKYQLFKETDTPFPAIMQWGEIYGYFREEDGKISDAFSFYVIVEKPAPAMVRLSVGTLHERTRWKQCMIQGFSRWQSGKLAEAESQLNNDLKRIERKWVNTQFGIELIKDLDNALRMDLEYRTVGFRCLLEEELKRLSNGCGIKRNSSCTSDATVTDIEHCNDEVDCKDAGATETYFTDLTTKEGIQDWLDLFTEWVNRLKFSLCSSGANITRSASELEARKRPSIPTVKKCETFSSRDSPNNDKRQTDVTFLNPPITKQKKDQRRISVSGFTNLFRIKSVKHDDVEKINDTTITPETNLDSEREGSILENLEMISEADYFLSGLTKDTVIAFNEINIAAKNITLELLSLRSKNALLDADLKKTLEEKQTYFEFYRKYQNSIKEKSPNPIGNNGHHKSDSNSYQPTGLQVHSQNADNLDTGENSLQPGHVDQKMADCRRQTETLREMYNKFEIEKKMWSKEYESQRTKNANDKEALFEKKQELQKEKEALAEKEKKYKEKCQILQEKIDKYNEILGFNIESEQPKVPEPKNQQFITTPHIRTHSEELNQKRNSKQTASIFGSMAPPLASTEATHYNTEQSTHDDPSIPDQLKGSLINQERQSLKTNSSDNILGKVSSSNYPKTKLTPSTDHKNIYSSTNTCYTRDDKEDRDCSSDIEDFRASSDNNVKQISIKKTVDIVETKTAISKTVLVSDNSKVGNRNSTITHTTSDTSSNKPISLGIPIGLATKSKVKSTKKTK